MVKVLTLDIAAFREGTKLQKFQYMARIVEGFYLHTQAFIHEWNEPYLLCLPSRSWFSFTALAGMEG